MDAQCDLAILEPTAPLDLEDAAPPFGNGDFYLSQRVLFIGFPVAVEVITPVVGLDFDSPFPMVKGGILAAMNDDKVYIDQVANAGFSGSPIVYREIETGAVKILGMISQTGTERLWEGADAHYASAIAVGVAAKRIVAEFERVGL